MATFDLAEASVEFTSDTEANWNNFPLPIPANVVVYTVDTQKFKRGDGSRRYSELPEGPSIAGIAAGESALVNVLTQLIPTDEDCLIVIEDEIYKASTTKLSDLVTRLSAIANKDTIQNANMDAIASQFGMVDASIIPGDVGKLAVIGNHKMKPGVLPETIVSIAPVNPVNIRKFETYSDLACTVPCDSFNYDSVYYAKIEGCHDTADIDNLSFSLTEASEYVTITALGRGIFKIVIGRPATTTGVVLTATVAYNTDTVSVNKTVTINQYVPILVGVYGGSAGEQFFAAVFNSNGDLFVVGNTGSEGSGSSSSLIIKFDSNLNIIAKKLYSGANIEIWYNVAIDTNDNVFAVGYTTTESAVPGTNKSALIVKFDSSLNILAKKRYSGAEVTTQFESIITDSNNNIFVCGIASVNSTDGIIIKFDNNLNVLAQKTSNGAGNDQCFGITTDTANNIYVVGSTKSVGLGVEEAFIIKFDNSLNTLAKKIYGGTLGDGYWDVTIDSVNNIYAVGNTFNEGTGGSECLIVKYDSNLNILAKKRYGGTGADRFYSAKIDSNDNVICVGQTGSEGLGGATYGDALIVKFDSNLNILAKKRYGGTGEDNFYGVAVDKLDNVFVMGYTTYTFGGVDALIMKLSQYIPSGIHISPTITTLILDESNLELGESNLTAADCALVPITGSLAFVDSALTLSISNRTYVLGEI